jgi:hypothetical protein
VRAQDELRRDIGEQFLEQLPAFGKRCWQQRLLACRWPLAAWSGGGSGVRTRLGMADVTDYHGGTCHSQ